LVRKPDGKRSFRKVRPRWEDNIKMDLQELESEYMDKIDLVQNMDRWWTHVNAVMNFRVTQNAGNFLTG